jgi:hypothetical protein
MKNLFFKLLILVSITIYSQDKVQEPDFIGEAFIIESDNSILPLEKETIELKTSAGVSITIITVAKTKKKIKINGCCSKVVYKPKTELI